MRRRCASMLLFSLSFSTTVDFQRNNACCSFVTSTVQAPNPDLESTPPTAPSKEYLMNQLAIVHMEAGNKAQEIAKKLVEKANEEHRADRSNLEKQLFDANGKIKHLM